MSTRAKVLAILSLPAGALGYLATGAVLGAMSLPDALGGVLALFLPLLVGGLCMAPFLVPFFDQMAKRDLAAIQAQRAADAADTTESDDPSVAP